MTKEPPHHPPSPPPPPYSAFEDGRRRSGAIFRLSWMKTSSSIRRWIHRRRRRRRRHRCYRRRCRGDRLRSSRISLRCCPEWLLKNETEKITYAVRALLPCHFISPSFHFTTHFLPHSLRRRSPFEHLIPLFILRFQHTPIVSLLPSHPIILC